MFERFTDRARRVVVLAQEQSKALNHDYIGTEHVLLGLAEEGGGIAADALLSCGVTTELAKAAVLEIAPMGNAPVYGHLPFTPRAKKVIEMALREALQLGHSYIGTEHILLGLLREKDSVGVAALVAQLGPDARGEVRAAVIQKLGSYVASPLILDDPPAAPDISRGRPGVNFSRNGNTAALSVVNQGDVRILRVTVTFEDAEGRLRRRTMNWK